MDDLAVAGRIGCACTRATVTTWHSSLASPLTCLHSPPEPTPAAPVITCLSCHPSHPCCPICRSVFFISHDDQFMIKTMHKEEIKLLLRWAEEARGNRPG